MPFFFSFQCLTEAEGEKKTTLHVAAKLYHTLSRARTYIDLKSMSLNSCSDDTDITLEHLDQILAKIPALTKTVEVDYLKEKAKSNAQLVKELCTFVNDVTGEMQDLSLSRTEFSGWTEQTNSETCKQDIGLEAMIWRVSERLEGYEGL